MLFLKLSNFLPLYFVSRVRTSYSIINLFRLWIGSMLYSFSTRWIGIVILVGGGIIFLKFDWHSPSSPLGSTSENRIHVLIYYYVVCCGEMSLLRATSSLIAILLPKTYEDDLSKIYTYWIRVAQYTLSSHLRIVF